MNHANANTHHEPNTHSATGSTTQRVADTLHEGIDKAAEKGEQWEKKLQEKGKQAQEKSRELSGSFTQLVHDRPWAVVGGAVALGVLIGALTRR